MQGIRALFVCLALLGLALPACQAKEAPPFPIGSKLSLAVQKYTGLNRLAGWAASSVATRVLRRQVGGKAKAQIRTFSLTDLLAGKIRSLVVSLSGSAYRGVPLGDVRLIAANPVWVDYRSSNKAKRGLRNPVHVWIGGSLTEKDVSFALTTPSVVTALSMLRLELPGLGEQQLKLLDPKVDIEKDKIKLQSTLITANAAPDSGLSVSISGKPYLQGSRIFVKDLQVSSAEVPLSDNFAEFMQPLLNPVVDLARMDRSSHAFRLASLNIDADKITFDGTLLVGPKTSAAEQSSGKK